MTLLHSVILYGSVNYCGSGMMTNFRKSYLGSGHSMWPGDLTLESMSSKSTHNMWNACGNSYAIFLGAPRRRLFATHEKPPGGRISAPPIGARINPRRHRGVDAPPKGFLGITHVKKRRIATKLWISVYWSILHLLSKFCDPHPNVPWSVIYFSRSC